MGTSYSNAVGNPPVCTELSFQTWLMNLLNFRLNETITARATTYYFAQGGNDSTGNGTQATPYKTLAKAQTLLANNVRLRFNRGDTWNESAGLTVASTGVTIDDYGSANLPKPYFKQFRSAPYTSASWTLTSGQTYTWQQAETSTIAWLREVDDVTSEPYIRATSIATVEANPGSYWWDSVNQIVYVHNRFNLAATNTAYKYEAVVSNTVSAIRCTSASSDVRIENIRCDGWSAIYSASGGTNDGNSNYNIRSEMTGTNACLLVGVEAYYSTYHNVGGNSSSSGGIFTCVNCKAGRTISTSGTNFVAYANSGGNEGFFFQCQTNGGCTYQIGQNYLNVQEAGLGTPVYMHTASGAFSLGIAWRCFNTPGQYQEGTPTLFANCPSAGGDLSGTRAFVVEDTFNVRDRSAIDAANDGVANRWIGSDCGPGLNSDLNLVRINSTVNLRWYSSLVSTSQGVFGNVSGTYINCRFVLDGIGYRTSNAPAAGICIAWSQQASSFSASLFNCMIEWRTYSNCNTAFLYLCQVLNDSSHNATAGFIANSIIASRNLKPSAVGYVALNNSSSFLSNNNYVNIGGKTDTYRGYSNDPHYVESADRVLVGPLYTSSLRSANFAKIGNYTLKYDELWNKRELGQPCIGPREYIHPYPRLTA